MPHLHPVHWNLTAPFLYEHAVRRGEGDIGLGGSFVANTGRHTGRSPRDKYIVNEPGTKDTVDWGAINQPIDAGPVRQPARSGCSPICRGASCSCRTSTAAPIPNTGCRCGSSARAPGTACSRATCSSGRRSAELADFQPAFTILHAPDFRAIPELDGIRSETFIFVNFASRLVLIGGTRYAGEIKKSVFGYLNFVLPARDVLPMHCSANVGPKGDARDLFRPVRHRQDDLVGRRLAHADRRRRARLEPAGASSISRAAATPRSSICRRPPSRRSTRRSPASARCSKTSCSTR